MKILVASGSFKDVFNPIEAVKVIGDALNNETNEVTCLPFCDGGEYTYEVLQHSFHYETAVVEHVLNPYGKTKDVHYLVNEGEAHLISSNVLRLFPVEDSFKNPLNLTDYGYGQIISDAIERGCRKLILYLGGTSTACCGFGTIQALGAKLYSEEGRLIDTPCKAADLQNIKFIEADKSAFSDIELHVVADGNSKVNALPGITALKIGKCFSKDREAIVSNVMSGIENVVSLTGISPEKDFTGAAGGLLFGLEQVFTNVHYTLGGLFFNRVLNIEPEIEKSDLIITGEGRYDNTADGKAPSVITQLAKKHNKPAILVCGQHDKKKIPDYSGGYIDCKNNKQFCEQGITAIITGQEYYDSITLPDSYQDCISLFRSKTPTILKQLFSKAGL